MDDRDHLKRLMAMTAPDQGTWDLSENDVAAIRWALRRIEAFPELLAALKSLVAQIGTDEGISWAFNLRAARAAIGKAEGR